MSITSGQQATVGDPAVVPQKLPRLEAGDRLDQPTFHARYEAMPSGTRAELIEGYVHMPSPTRPQHGATHIEVVRWMLPFQEASPGVTLCIDTTFIMGKKYEVQPDVAGVLAAEYGGQVHLEEYFHGAPELSVEVALTTESYDLHSKLRIYEASGVLEYVVVALWQSEVFWFVNRHGKLERLAPGADGILRSEVFPGLWLDPVALLARDFRRVLEVARLGIASPEHQAWIERLKAVKAIHDKQKGSP